MMPRSVAHGEVLGWCQRRFYRRNRNLQRVRMKLNERKMGFRSYATVIGLRADENIILRTGAAGTDVSGFF